MNFCIWCPTTSVHSQKIEQMTMWLKYSNKTPVNQIHLQNFVWNKLYESRHTLCGLFWEIYTEKDEEFIVKVFISLHCTCCLMDYFFSHILSRRWYCHMITQHTNSFEKWKHWLQKHSWVKIINELVCRKEMQDLLVFSIFCI